MPVNVGVIGRASIRAGYIPSAPQAERRCTLMMATMMATDESHLVVEDAPGELHRRLPIAAIERDETTQVMALVTTTRSGSRPRRPGQPEDPSNDLRSRSVRRRLLWTAGRRLGSRRWLGLFGAKGTRGACSIRWEWGHPVQTKER